jgi:hypothetical protein
MRNLENPAFRFGQKYSDLVRDAAKSPNFVRTGMSAHVRPQIVQICSDCDNRSQKAPDSFGRLPPAARGARPTSIDQAR